MELENRRPRRQRSTAGSSGKVQVTVKETQDNISQMAEKNIVIAFVDALERADQYFNFKEYLKQEIPIKPDSDPESIFNTVSEMPLRKERFEMVEDKLIRDAIDWRILVEKELQVVHSRYHYRMYLTRCEFITLESKYMDDIKAACNLDQFPGLSVRQMKGELTEYKLFLLSLPYSKKETDVMFMTVTEKEKSNALAKWNEDKDYYASEDVIYDLAFRARRAQYIMDKDPDKELEKILVLRPRKYHALVSELRKMIKSDHEPPIKSSSQFNMPPKTVMVWVLPPNASEDNVRDSFSSCGEIKDVEIQRIKESRVAYVTYKDSEAAHHARCLLSPKVCNQPVRVTPASYFRCRSTSPDISLSEFKDVKAASYIEPSVEAVEERLRSMRDQALTKYSELIRRYSVSAMVM